jgi:TolB-like protein/DNA-binding winged helix-turn-helix (wHTH) protein/tetratricopeptide (TPR) repeat protein
MEDRGPMFSAQDSGKRPASVPSRILRFGVFELDARSGELRRHGLRIRLPHQAFQILQLLLSRPGEIVSREEIRERLWKAGTHVEFDVSLNTAVRKLREALDDSVEHPQFIETLPRRGYRFIGSVQGVADRTSEGPASDIAPAASRARTKAVGGAVVLTAVMATLAIGYERGWLLRAGTTAAEIRSLAVLPFENLTGDPAQEYLADAITDAVTTHLAQIEPVNVISRTSAMQYKATTKRLPDIGTELKVDALVQGAVVRSGHQLRISARVVQASTDRHVWAQSYDGGLGEIIALQQKIAGDVATAIGRRLTPVHTRRLQTVDPEAADAYLKGLHAAGQLTYEGFRTAVAYFDEAVARQPDYAEAYAALAHTQLRFLFTGPLSPRQTVPKAEAAARRALQLEETLARSHLTLGQVLTHFYWKWDEGEKEFRRAHELSPHLAQSIQTESIDLVRTARLDEIIARAERERRREPQSFDAHVNLAVAYRAAAQYDRAIAELRRALEIIPGRPRAHFQLGVTFVAMAQNDDAIRELDAAVRASRGATPRFIAYLGYAYATAGRAFDARRILNELESRARHQYVSSFGMALIHDALGEREPALAALERAYEDRAVEFAQMSRYPAFRTIASDPRYEAVMRRIGLPR